MALTLNPEAQLVFFTKVFGPSHDVTKKVQQLIAAGVTFETSLYTVKATWKGKPYSVGLTKGTTSLMKHVVDPIIAAQNKQFIVDWVAVLSLKVLGSPVVAQQPPVSEMAKQGASLYQKQDVTSQAVTVVLKGTTNTSQVLALIKAVQVMTGSGLAAAKQTVDGAMLGTPQLLKMVPTLDLAKIAAEPLIAAGGDIEFVIGPLDEAGKSIHIGTVTGDLSNVTEAFENLGAAMGAKPVPVNKVIDLQSAKALGQKVHGTSSGSVYYCIAYSEQVKVAARILKGGGISIRAEWTGSPTAELKKLEESGVQLKANYGSMHFDAGEVPLSRVIGAFLVGTGINWKAAVMNGAELIVAEKA